MADFDFEIEYRSGMKHGNADGMSRRPWNRLGDCTGEAKLPACGPCCKCERQMERTVDNVCAIKTRSASCQRSSSPKEIGCPNDDSVHIAEEENKTHGSYQTSEWTFSYTPSELRNYQKEDKDIGRVIQWMEESESRPATHNLLSENPCLRNLWLLWDSLVLHRVCI